tara:strand:- start:167 stop:358 length:192 start_codon:yes stop_codon:yes gene_type:complete
MENFDKVKLHKMSFIMNALDEGWSVKKKKEIYIFTKKHEGRKEVFNEKYLENFVKKNMELKNN